MNARTPPQTLKVLYYPTWAGHSIMKSVQQCIYLEVGRILLI